MNREVTNTFVGGMRKDIDKSLMSKDTYLDARNFRLITTQGSSSGSLETIKGNYLIAGDGNIDTGQRIIGSCEIRDYVVLFTTNNTSTEPSGGRSMIYIAEIDADNETETSLDVVYDDNNNDGSSVSDFLNFSTTYPIKAISRYETPNVQKIYWTDGYNKIRFCDVAKNLTVSGEAYSAGVNNYMSTDKFEFLPNFSTTKPMLSDIVGGKLKTGVVQYSYQLYRLNGAETAFSPVSNTIHITSDNDFNLNTNFYTGDGEPIDSGKGCKICINNTDNVGYDRLRLIRLYYPTLHAVPVISIAAEIEIEVGGSTVYLVDSGNSIGELTIDEFNLSSTDLFSCEDIAVKDDLLFASNIEYGEYEVDFDFRAVRFKAGAKAVVYDGTDALELETTFSDWDDYEDNHDGINKFNDPDNDGDSAYAYKYQSNLTTIGAEGLNVKIDFEDEQFVLDSSGDNETYYAVSPGSGSNLSFTNYASPWYAGKLSFQRDEVYRFYAVCRSSRGQVSRPYWIIDLRMPSLHDADFTNSSSQTVKPSVLADLSIPTGDIYSRRLYPRIQFKNWPTDDVESIQIYMVKRERADRSVVTQGFVIPTYAYGVKNYPYTASTAVQADNPIFKLVSPEVMINRDIARRGNDYIEYVTNFSSVSDTTLYDNEAGVKGHIYKLLENTRVAYADDTKSDVEDAKMVVPSSTNEDEVLLINDSYINYQPSLKAKGSSGLLIAHENLDWTAEGVDYVLVNYKANVYGSQYSGHTYEDRNYNVSIPCSGLITAEDIWYDIENGDTFINYFDVSTLLYDLSQGEAMDTSFESVYVPVESTINCDLRHDTDQQHFATNKGSTYWAFRQEYAGEHSMTYYDESYNQENDLYLYNTVYSCLGNAQYSINLPTDSTIETEFDYMVKASNKKSNGELSDSWTKFGINEFIEVDSAHGPINALTNFNDRLIYFQDKAFGLLSVNDRSLISDQASAQLVLGTGGVLDRYTYASTHCGCQDKFSVCTSKSGLYWYDRLINSIFRYSDTLTNLSKVKELQSYLNTSDTIDDNDFSVISYSDVKNDEILFTFYKESETNGFTISYSELVDAFVSFYDFIPTIYIPFKYRYMTTTNSYYCSSGFNRDRLFMQDSNVADRCYFYNVGYVDSTLKLLFNPEYTLTKVFDNIYYISNVYSDTTDIFDNTFTLFRGYDDYQNTDYVTLTPDDNIRRRERGWFFAIPRNVVDTNVSSNPDIFVDLDSTQTFKERMRDKYLIADFTYENDGTYDRFVVSQVGLKYRNSIR